MIVYSNPKFLPSNPNIRLLPVPLRRLDPTSPWCYCASISPSLVEDDNDTTSPVFPPGTNFLAIQVWPSSRTASFVLEKYCNPKWTVCELGCGPGLPSLTAASVGARVIATDVDQMALQMVQFAALEQGWTNERVVTRVFDLTKRNQLPDADLYVLSDVFESSAVAKGAAWHVKTLLDINNDVSAETKEVRFWVFAQSDRAQREVFLNSLRELDSFSHLEWNTNHEPDVDSRIWLFDLNEMGVQYN
jgi:hypothetical protein